MDVLLNEHQRLLADSAARLCGEVGGSARARTMAGEHLDRVAWARMAEAGWLGLMVPEALGGLGLGMVELGLIQVAVGAQSVRAPIAAGAIAAGGLARGGDAAVLASILAGEKIVLPAMNGAGTAFAPAGPLPRATLAGNRWSLRGEHRMVPDAAAADLLLVAAEAPEGDMMLFVLPVEATALVSHPAVDGSMLGDVVFQDTSLDAAAMLARGPEAAALVGSMRACLPLSVAFELLGLGDAAVDLTLAQLKLREQFGRPIGAFQALQHRMVDSFIARELLRSLLFRVAAAIDAGSGRAAMVAAAKAKAGSSVLDLVRRGVQIHGAMGYAEEHDIGLHYKRALTLSSHHGNEAYHLARFAELTHA